MSLSAAADEIGVALESTLLAEREIASGRLVRPLQGISEDVVYTGHWLVFPRSKRFARSMVTFTSWLTKQLGLDINLATLDEVTSGHISTPVLRAKSPLVDR